MSHPAQEALESSKKEKKEHPYGPGLGYKKIDVYHNGKYAHSTNFAKNTKIAKAKSGLEGKVVAKYSK